MIEESIMGKLDCVCIRENQNSLKFSVKKLLEQKISSMNCGAYFEVQDARILSKLGGTIVFLGMRQQTAESIKSLESFDRAFVEEAQVLSQRSLDLLRPTIRKPGSELHFAWNPRFATDPIDVFLRGKNPPPDSTVIEVNYEGNPFLPQVLKEEIAYDRGRDIDKFNHVWLGRYVERSSSRVFNNFTVSEFDDPEGVTPRFGADWGFQDPTCLVRAYTVGRKLFVSHEAYMHECPIDQVPDLFATVPDSQRYFITCDSSRPDTINYMKVHGYPKLVPAVKGPGSVEDGIEFLKTYDIVVHSRCTHVIDELNLYSWKVDVQTDEILPVLCDRNNHLIDSLRYACEGLRRTRRSAVPQVQEVEQLGWMS
jgi:phage terminase large subunit